jgi:hypothetical protein
MRAFSLLRRPRSITSFALRHLVHLGRRARLRGGGRTPGRHAAGRKEHRQDADWHCQIGRQHRSRARRGRRRVKGTALVPIFEDEKTGPPFEGGPVFSYFVIFTALFLLRRLFDGVGHLGDRHQAARNLVEQHVGVFLLRERLRQQRHNRAVA